MKKLSKTWYRIALVICILSIILTACLTILVGHSAQQRRAAAAAERAEEQQALYAKMVSHLQTMKGLVKLIDKANHELGPDGKLTEENLAILQALVEPTAGNKIVGKEPWKDLVVLRIIVVNWVKEAVDTSQKLHEADKVLRDQPPASAAELKSYQQLTSLKDEITATYTQMELSLGVFLKKIDKILIEKMVEVGKEKERPQEPGRIVPIRPEEPPWWEYPFPPRPK